MRSRSKPALFRGVALGALPGFVAMMLGREMEEAKEELDRALARWEVATRAAESLGAELP